MRSTVPKIDSVLIRCTVRRQPGDGKTFFGLLLPLVELRDYAHSPLDTLVFQDLETLDSGTRKGDKQGAQLPLKDSLTANR